MPLCEGEDEGVCASVRVLYGVCFCVRVKMRVFVPVWRCYSEGVCLSVRVRNRVCVPV